MAAPPGHRDPALEPTLQDTQLDAGRPIDSTPLRSLDFTERYVPTTSLGQGGMGVVLSVRDEQIGREIAIKRLLSSRRDNPSVRARFQREARVQAQLEHPSIVPVYDLGVDEQGDAWFTMKKIRGITLASVIGGLRAKDPDIVERFTRRRLLTAFTNVCLAIDFAHTHGVVHRDLKPENVMLGEFGEVYVLDWGIAKIAGVSDAELSATQPPGAGDGPGTQVGEVLGTIGYMPPEQLSGASTVGPRSDVWSLGAILFELLTLEPLLPRMTLGEAIMASDEPIEARPSKRAPDLVVTAGLDTICERATARAILDRYPSARALHDDVMLYLDGDLEAQRRREQAAAHLHRARDAEENAARDGSDRSAQRTLAMQEVNRALALDPANDDAKHTMVRMLAEPQPVLPPAARAELEASRAGVTRVAFKVGAFGFLAMYLFLPMYLWMGIRDWTLTGAVLALIATSAALLWWGATVPSRARVAMLLTIISAGALIALLSRVVGTFASAPLLAFLMAVGLVFNSTQLGIKSVLALVLIALGIPLALELSGVIEPSYAYAGGAIVVVPHMTNLPAVPTTITMALTCLSTIGLAAFYLMRVHGQLRSTQEQLWGYSWNLRQFLPALPPAPQTRPEPAQSVARL
jgi:eukaryotic-like serine/threonine-protein kinase